METIFSTKFVLPFFTNCTMYTHPISQPYTSLLQGSCRNSENITFLSIAGLKLFLKIFYFICFYLFWPHGEVSLSASRFYSIHSVATAKWEFEPRSFMGLNTVYFFERSSGSKVTILENGGVHGRLNNFKGPG